MSIKSKRIIFLIKKLGIYILVSIPMTFLLLKVIENKYTVIFWIYMGTMGITAIIMEWHEHSDNKSTFVKICEHICFVSVITLFLSWFVNVFFN